MEAKGHLGQWVSTVGTVMPFLLEETEAQEGGGPTAPEGSSGW